MAAAEGVKRKEWFKPGNPEYERSMGAGCSPSAGGCERLWLAETEFYIANANCLYLCRFADEVQTSFTVHAGKRRVLMVLLAPLDVLADHAFARA
ncbi:MAG TPA: hypothetical protein VMA55_13355 [Acidovorax sp.]|jgi:hypothetical protein|nr:hypothetical protein [Acidovorax sp.]